MHYTYRTKGVCSRKISLDIDEQNRIEKVEFEGGCPGNTVGISKLAVGMDARELAKRVAGTTCGFKSTSCPDQLTKALEEIKSKQ